MITIDISPTPTPSDLGTKETSLTATAFGLAGVRRELIRRVLLALAGGERVRVLLIDMTPRDVARALLEEDL